jgi:hypothetical protein
MGMDEDGLQQLKEELRKTDEQLQETQHFIHELHLSYGFGALILAGLVAVVLQAFSYLLYGSVVTQLNVLLFMFSLLVGPAALFLLFLHVYELYGIVKNGEKSVPLTLDLTYFLYVAVAFATMMGLNTYYQNHNISWQFLTAGWSLAVALLSLGVLIALLLAKFMVTFFIAPWLPHFFGLVAEHHKIHQHYEKKHVRPTGMYFFRKKPDVSRWQDQDCFVKF